MVRILYVIPTDAVSYIQRVYERCSPFHNFVTYSYFVFNMVTDVQILYYVSFNVQILQ